MKKQKKSISVNDISFNQTMVPSISGMESVFKKEWDIFDDGRCKHEDEILEFMFAKLKYDNSLQSVYIKCVIINNLYNAGVLNKDIYTVAKAINKIGDFNDRINEFDSKLVNEIASSGTRVYFSFASKYCALHNKESYPIYDNIVNRVLKLINENDKFTEKLDRRMPSDIGDKYFIYKEVLEDLKKHFKLDRYSYRDMDKFLWLRGKQALKELKEQH